MTLWFFLLGLPLLGYGLASLLATNWTAKMLVAFPRCKQAGWVLCAVAWFWTAYECDTIGIDVFDKYLKVFPGQIWIMAIVLTVLTCWWMENLLPIRGVCGLFMLFPGEMFPMIRLCDTQWRLTLVVFAYICAITGMVGMFYPWRIRQALAWRAEKPIRVRAVGGVLTAVGALFVVLGSLAAAGCCH